MLSELQWKCIFLGDPGLCKVWICGYVSLRAFSESIHLSSCGSCHSGSVKVHLRSVPNTIQWALLTGVCKFSGIHHICATNFNQDFLRIHHTLCCVYVDTNTSVWAAAQYPSAHPAGQWCVYHSAHHCQGAEQQIQRKIASANTSGTYYCMFLFFTFLFKIGIYDICLLFHDFDWVIKTSVSSLYTYMNLVYF